ncbi:MAG TPA: YncE family protein, partial [Dehalococcoidia bacterium]|nr:YncE family protein [Dehalococcoidia bacterium]
GEERVETRVMTLKLRGTAIFIVAFTLLFLGVWNASADTVGAPITVGTNPQQAQLTPDGSKLYISNEGNVTTCPIPAGTLSVINTSTSSLSTIAVGVNPGPVRFSPDGSRAFVVNQSDCDSIGTVSVINVSTSAVLATVPVGKLPVTLSVSQDGAKVYVANKGATSNSVSVLCTGFVPAVCSAANTVITTIPLDTNIAIQPHVMAKTPNGAELWVAEQDCPAVIGCATGNVAVICTGFVVTSTCNAGNADTVIANVTVGPTPGSLHFTHDGTRAYVATRGNGSATVPVPAAVADVNATTHAVSATIQIHPADATLPAPHALRVASDDSKVYVANRHANDIDVICTGIVPAACAGTDVVVKHIAVGTSPSRTELTPNGGRLYVTNELSNTATVISTNLDQAMETINVGSGPVDLEINASGTKAFTSNATSNDVSVITISGDTDYDGYPDSLESGQPLCGNGKNDDDFEDTVVDDGCPGGPAKVGTFSEAQFNIGTSSVDPCGLSSWPSDLVWGGTPNSTNKVTITDLTSFLAPARHLDTSPGNPNFNRRWDLVPGRGLFPNWIAINDLTALLSGASGAPPMFGGARAFGGPLCPG